MDRQWASLCCLQLSWGTTNGLIGKMVSRGEEEDKYTMSTPYPQLQQRDGGVDLADMLIALYRIPMKTKRWYIKVFWHLVDICKTNAWLLYRRDCDLLEVPKKSRMTYINFIIEIADALISANKVQKRPTPGRPKRNSTEANFQAAPAAKFGRKQTTPLPCDEARFDLLGHWPEHGKRQRCRNCPDGFSKIYCSKCKICLCLRDGKNCFLD